jgi:hypothetical protein
VLPRAARADPAIGRYEALRAVVLAGSGGGWRHGLPVLAASGLAAWLAQGPALDEPGAGAGSTGSRAAMPRAGQSPSAPGLVPPGPARKGGDAAPAASTSLPVTADVVAVLAQMALSHARPSPP